MYSNMSFRDANEITRQLLVNVLNDPSGLITARAVARQAITAANIPGFTRGNLVKGAVVTDANLAAYYGFQCNSNWCS